jgi:hypothetical protein
VDELITRWNSINQKCNNQLSLGLTVSSIDVRWLRLIQLSIITKATSDQLVAILEDATNSEFASNLFATIVQLGKRHIGIIAQKLSHARMGEIITNIPSSDKTATIYRILKILSCNSAMVNAISFMERYATPEIVSNLLISLSRDPFCALELWKQVPADTKKKVANLFTPDRLMRFSSHSSDIPGNYRYSNSLMCAIIELREDPNFTYSVIREMSFGNFYNFLEQNYPKLAEEAARVIFPEGESPAEVGEPFSVEELWSVDSGEAGKQVAHLWQRDPGEIVSIFAALSGATVGKKDLARKIMVEAVRELAPDSQKIAKFLQLGLENGLSVERVGLALIDLAHSYHDMGTAIAREALSLLTDAMQNSLITAVATENKGVAVRIFDAKRINNYLNMAQGNNERAGILLAISGYDSTPLNSILFKYVLDNGLSNFINENIEILALSDGEKTLREHVCEPSVWAKFEKTVNLSTLLGALLYFSDEQMGMLFSCPHIAKILNIQNLLSIYKKRLICTSLLDIFNDRLAKLEKVLPAETFLKFSKGLLERRKEFIEAQI